jgi:hypothetical protein
MIYSRLQPDTIYKVMLPLGGLLVLFSYWIADGLAKTLRLVAFDQLGAVYPWMAFLVTVLLGLAVLGLCLPVMLVGEMRRGRVPRRHIAKFRNLALVVLAAEIAASQCLTLCLSLSTDHP